MYLYVSLYIHVIRQSVVGSGNRKRKRLSTDSKVKSTTTKKENFTKWNKMTQFCFRLSLRRKCIASNPLTHSPRNPPYQVWARMGWVIFNFVVLSRYLRPCTTFCDFLMLRVHHNALPLSKLLPTLRMNIPYYERMPKKDAVRRYIPDYTAS